MKTFKHFFSEDGGAAVATSAPTSTTAGVSGAGDNPDKTVPVSVDAQKKYTKANKNTVQPSLHRRQSRVNAVSPPVSEELKFNQEKITSSNSKTSKDPTGFAVGDSGHLGFAVKGGLGFRGKIKKIDGDNITIKSSTTGMFGPKEFKGHYRKFTKDD